MPQALHVGWKERELRRERLRALNSPFWFATEVCGFDKLREDLHKPLMDEQARRARLYFRWVKGGLTAEEAKEYKRKELLMMKRGGYKTTMLIVEVILDLLRDPAHSFMWFHAVEDRAVESAAKIAELLQMTKKDGSKCVRDFFAADVRPPSVSRGKRWYSGGKFDFKCGGSEPTFRALGAGGESTGGHCRTGIFDDIIGKKTVEDSAMPKVRSWLADSADKIVDRDGRQKFRGTHWDEDDVYTDMRGNPDFYIDILPAKDEDGGCIPHRAGQTVAQANKERKEAERAPGATAFIISCQEDNDPLPSSERRWDLASESGMWTTWREIRDVPGRVFVFSDPAPKGISLRGDKDKERGGAGGDYWSVAVMKLFVDGDFQYAALIYGVRSLTWGLRQGFDECVRLMERYGSKHFFNESYSGISWFNEFRIAARALGLRHVRGKDGGPLRYKDTHAANQKNLRFEAFADRAREGDFLICEDSCPQDFLYGDGAKTGVLTQARKWMPLQKGRNNLKFDDDMDCVSRFTDSAVSAYVDRPLFENTAINSPLWVRQYGEEEEFSWGTRHIRV